MLRMARARKAKRVATPVTWTLEGDDWHGEVSESLTVWILRQENGWVATASDDGGEEVWRNGPFLAADLAMRTAERYLDLGVRLSHHDLRGESFYHTGDT